MRYAASSRFPKRRVAALAALALSWFLVAQPVPAADPPPSDGPWLATQAMGTALASTLAAAKVDVTWSKVLGLNDAGFCLVGVHLAKGSVYSSPIAMQKDLKYRIHAYSGSTSDAELTLMDPSGRKVAASTPRADAGAVLTFKPKADGAYTLRMTYAGSQSGERACAYVVLREGGAHVTASTIESTMLNLAGQLDVISAASPTAHFLGTDGQVAAVATVLQQSTPRTLDAVAFPSGAHCVVAVSDGAASDIDLSATPAGGAAVAGSELPGVPLNVETLQFQGSGTYALKFAEAAVPGPSFVIGLMLTSGGAAVAPTPGVAAMPVPAFAKPMDQAIRHGLSIGAFLADEAENRLADGPSIMGGLLLDGAMFRAPKILQPGILYTIIACGDEGVAEVELVVTNIHGDVMGDRMALNGIATVTFKPQSVDNIYTLQVKQVKSSGGRHACAVLTFRAAGAGISYTDVKQSLDNMNAALQKVADAGGPISYNDMGGQVSLYGTMLSDQESRLYTDIGVPVGDHLFVAAADSHSKDIDLIVSSNDQLVVAKDKDVSPNPIVPYNGVGTVSVKIMNKKATDTSMTMLGILNVAAPK